MDEIKQPWIAVNWPWISWVICHLAGLLVGTMVYLRRERELRRREKDEKELD